MKPSITDWLMVVITAVYVIATICIFVANNKSANAAADQTKEMKRQFEENNRPNIEVEFVYERRMWYIVRFVNHGRHNAQRFKIELDQDFIDSLPKANIRALLEKQKGKEGIIGAGQRYDLYIGSNEIRNIKDWKPLTGTIKYQFNGKEYSSPIYIDIENYVTFFSSNTEEEDLLKAIKECNQTLKSINNTIMSDHVTEKNEDI